MLTLMLALAMMFDLPPSNPQLPLVVLRTTVDVTANTEISHSVTIASSPQAIGYSSYFGVFQSFNGIVMSTPATGPCTGQFPCTSPGGNAAYSQ